MDELKKCLQRVKNFIKALSIYRIISAEKINFLDWLFTLNYG